MLDFAIDAQPLPTETSVQRVELIALTQGLFLAKDKNYTNSK